MTIEIIPITNDVVLKPESAFCLSANFSISFVLIIIVIVITNIVTSLNPPSCLKDLLPFQGLFLLLSMIFLLT